MSAAQHPHSQALPDHLRNARRTALAAVGALALAGACRASVAHLLGGSDGAPAPAEQLFGALATRYTDVRRDAKIDIARNRLAQGALIPSRVFDDTAAWTTIVSSHVRTLAYRGDGVGGRFYLLRALPSGAHAPPVTAPGDTRHNITLTYLKPDEYRWDITTDFALGAVSPPTVSSTLGALFASAERRAEGDVRADYRATFPRASATNHVAPPGRSRST